MAAEGESAGGQSSETAEQEISREHESARVANQFHSTAITVSENPFDRDEIKQFEADDIETGKVIGKMLSLFFIYTIIAMALVGYLTWSKILN